MTRNAVIDGFTVTNGRGTVLPPLDCDRAGGGIYCLDSSPTISNNVVAQNSAVGGGCGTREAMGQGGGIYCKGGSPRIIGNRISQNSTSADGSIGYGGGVYGESCPEVEITGNVISDHSITEGQGGGIYLKSSRGTVANNTVVRNTATINIGVNIDTGGIFVWPSPSLTDYQSITLANNIVAFNSTGIYKEGGTVILRNNCVYGNEHSGTTADYSWIDPGEGDISLPPGLAGDGYHIQAGSPCVNAGDDLYVGSATDIDGEYRVRGGKVDIGADESSEGCIWYRVALTVSLDTAEEDSYVVVAAVVYDPATGLGVVGVPVAFIANGGSVADSPVLTNNQGIASTSVTRDTAGYLHVTATAQAVAPEDVGVCGSHDVADSRSIWFYPTQAVGGEWPMFMHNAQHTGISDFIDTVSTQTFSTPTWQQAAPAMALEYLDFYSYDSSPVVARGLVVIGTYTSELCSYVRAFDAGTGSVVWTADDRHTMRGVVSTPCIADGRVYVTSLDARLYCLDLADGRQLWKVPLSGSLTPTTTVSSPVVHEGLVYAASGDGLVFAFNAISGYLAPGWPVDLDADVCASPAIATVSGQDYLLLGTAEGKLYRITLCTDPPSTQSVTLNGPIASSASVSGGYAYVGSTAQTDNFFGLTVDPLAINQTADLGEEVRTTPALGFGYVYVGCDTGYTLWQLQASDLSTDEDGDLIPGSYYRFDVGTAEYFIGSAALTNASSITGSILYTGNDNHNLYARRALDVSLNPLTSSCHTGGVIRSSPAVAYIADDSGNLDRWVFITTQDEFGKLLAYKTDR